MRLAGDGSTLRRWAALPLRLIVGYGFIAHGYAKVDETNLLYIAALTTLVLGGSGPFAFDQMRSKPPAGSEQGRRANR